MSSKKQRRRERAERRARRRQENNSVSEGLKLLGYTSRKEYEAEWQKLKQTEANKMIQTKGEVTIPHDELIPVLWEWEVKVKDSTTKRDVKVKSKNKEKGGEVASLYVQGEQLFMIRNGITQKMTPMHDFVIFGDNGTKYEGNSTDVIKWTLENVKGQLQ